MEDLRVNHRTIAWLDPASERRIRVSEGDVYEFVDGCSTRSGLLHPRGSLLYVHDRTGGAPPSLRRSRIVWPGPHRTEGAMGHGEVGPRGHNWICRTQFDVSVWTTLEHCIERGVLRKVGQSWLRKVGPS